MSEVEPERPAGDGAASRVVVRHSCKRLICVGFRRWRAWNLLPLLSFATEGTYFVPDAAAAARLKPQREDALLYWGRDAPPGVPALAERSGAAVLRLEDGFVRSVGLGSDLIRPLSLVVDGRGIYFDPTQTSDLEQLLNSTHFSEEECARALRIRQFIAEHGITKYNLEPRQDPQWAAGTGQRVVLVPGQVEDDASIRYGCTQVKTNMGLLQAARLACPGAYVVYKPHPDVVSGNRSGQVSMAKAQEWADHVETHLSVVSCIDACDEVHTMTSLTGFDALLRGKKVVTYGQPFYAGWGLTHDRAGDGGARTAAFDRRHRRLTLDELVAGALLHYPIYWDWKRGRFTTCEAVLRTILAERTALEAVGGLERLRTGWLRRHARKVGVLWRAWTHRSALRSQN